MSDDPFPPSKRGTNPRSLANLIPPAAKGEPSRNPKGNNGRVRGEIVAAFLAEVDSTPIGIELMKKVGCPDGSRIKALLHREWLAGMGKSEPARKTLIEYAAGRAPEAPESLVDIPDGVSTEGRPLLDIIADVYRSRLVNGQLKEGELHKLTDLVLSIDQAKIALVFKLLGKDPGKNAEEILALVDRSPAALAADAATPPPEPTP
jgi:hypothetical protein